MSRHRPWIFATSAAAVFVAFALEAAAWQDPPAAKARRKVGFTDTPTLPDSRWRVHDSDRPQPRVVTPGTPASADAPGSPPSDAVVLFNGKDLSGWHGGGGKPATWKVEDGAIVVAPGSGTITTDAEFGDCQLHLEWAAPSPTKGDDQGRGNSGVLVFGLYEVQVLDCHDNLTYADGTTGAVYGQSPPLVNACRKPGEWQSYDIVFTAPRFGADGSLLAPAYFTVLLNGVLVQNHAKVIGAMAYRAVAKYTPHGPRGPLALQEHGNPVKYRNIWVRELKPGDRN